MNYHISVQLLQQVHDYLLTRPMREVEHLVVALRQIEVVVEKPLVPVKPLEEKRVFPKTHQQNGE